MMIDADEGVDQDGRGGGGIVVNFGLIPGTLQGQNHAFIVPGVVLRDCDQG